MKMSDDSPPQNDPIDDKERERASSDNPYDDHADDGPPRRHHDDGSGHHGDRFLHVVSMLSFANEYFGLVAHSLKGAEWAYDEEHNPLLKIAVDLVAVCCCAILGALHASHHETREAQVYTAVTPVIAAFVIPTLIMQTLLATMDHRSHESLRKLALGAFAIFGLASAEGYTARLIQEKRAYPMAPLLVLLALSFVLRTQQPHANHGSVPGPSSKPAALATIALLFAAAYRRSVVWETLRDADVVDAYLYYALVALLAYVAYANHVKRKVGAAPAQPS